ncbi:ZYRO0C14850p [Zygosaccharomyces rouxii]|uniref:ATP-dependent DNA helicase II subunit 1 n=1 Tax=Zygosaccharomyces rouxii (strain ATCC 2623 / CBS 732 / NBRC 1130 / NCYC 568 / NRRL Y-229) TaxID=559307 RepID=C5DU89_ZYGRC|nr:uncharacterized protein ZYRO0C14850g [Zygosaccharomyces rouxii]KAH9201477.1 SPOC like C-terminal domain-containing protein [Zygosaccharomyces rouxii]CAR27350.1 ZYRO0C14850p [Zygosaccharomyces rouxii]
MSSLDPLNVELEQQDKQHTQSKSYRKYEVHEGIIFCIELSAGMFQELSELNYKVQLVEILETLEQLMSQLVIVRPGTGIGCYFYNCNKDDAKNHIYEFFPLRDINAKSMKKLSDLLDDLANDRITLQKFLPYDESERTPLDFLYGFIQDEFLKEVEGQKAFNNKKVFLFTDNDSPPEAEDNETKSRLRHLVDDMDDHFINFTTFFIGKEEAPFDDSFYSDVLKLGATAEDPNTEFDGPNTTPISASYIKSRVLRKQEVKRIMFQCCLILEERMQFMVGIKGYTIIIQERPGQRYRLVYEKDEVRKEANSKRKFLDSNTGEVIEEGLTKVFPYGDLDITITDEELNEVRKSYTEEESFLKIIGFRDYNKCIHYFNNIDRALFVVPDEFRFEGSIRTLASLFKNLRAKGKVAVVWGKLKTNSHPAVFVLSPSRNEDPNEGFYLYRIPFAEELRRFPQSLIRHNSYDTPEYNQLKDTTKSIIDHFQFAKGYRPSEFRNPDLQKHFKILHDYLLQVEQEEEDDSPESSKQRLLSEDDSLLKLAQIRDKIMDSAQSSDPKKFQLDEYFQLWNRLYEDVSKATTLEDAPRPKPKQPRKKN